MRYDEDVFAALEFHDDGLEADYDVAVAGGVLVCLISFRFVSSCFVSVDQGEKGGKGKGGKGKRTILLLDTDSCIYLDLWLRNLRDTAL